MKIYNPEKHITVVQIPKKEIAKIDFAMCEQPKQTLKAFYDKQEDKPDIICNGGFFALSTGETIFNFKDNGKTVSNNAQYRWGIGTVNGELKFGCIDNEKFDDFVSAYPPLVEEGKVINITYAKELDYKARRTMLGYDKDNVYIVAVESPGMKYGEMQLLMFGLGCEFAINIDGGGSTKILEKGKSITSILHNRAVDNVVAVYLKKEKILYKVQVGAFSIKENAEKLQTELKKKGYDAFIVSQKG
jgi:hypothetical protein